MSKEHVYNVNVKWTGNKGEGTENYKSYSRNHLISAEGKATSITASSDPAFRGDPSRYNPEELFLSSLSACHMLWYLHLCTVAGIVVLDYDDHAEGIMCEEKGGSGRFTSVILKPQITIKDKNKLREAYELHEKANEMCFIANSCNFEIKHNPEIKVDTD